MKVSASSRFDLVTPVLILIFAVMFIGALATDPPMGFYAALLGIAALTIGVSALRNTMLFKIGLRNMARRKGYAMIVIAGLMIGTVIISSSLIIGDTMNNMTTSASYKGFDQTDLVIYGQDVDGSRVYISDVQYERLRQDILNISHVDGVMGQISEDVSVRDLDSGQFEPAVRLIGYETDSPEFGCFYADGKAVTMDLDEGEVYLAHNAASALDAKAGDSITVYTLRGPASFTIKEVLDAKGRSEGNSGNNFYMPIQYAALTLNITDGVNAVLVSNEGGLRGGADHCDEVKEEVDALLQAGDYQNLKVQLTKADDLDASKASAKMFTDLFLVFGSFAIIAGVVLIVNIFIMLGEERKGEMGISRAVGMDRSDLKRSFLYEGSVYAFISSMIGAVLGIPVAYFVIWFLDNLLGSFSGGGMEVLSYFDFTPLSIVTAVSFGSLITLVTVSFTSTRISKLNIIRAIRNLPEPGVPKDSKMPLVLGLALMLFSGALILCSYTIFDGSPVDSFIAASLYIGVCLLFIGAGLAASRFVGARLAGSLACALIMLLWLIPNSVFSLTSHAGGMEMFVLSGVFLVSSGVMLFLFNSNQVLGLISKGWGLTGRPTATLKTATTYPMKNKFRTGMTLYMFALIIFTITVMSMMSGILSYNIDKMAEEQSAGIDILGFGNPMDPIYDIDSRVEGSKNLSADDFNIIYSLYIAYVTENTDVKDPATGDLIQRQTGIIGIEDQFLERNTFDLKFRSKEFPDDRSAWRALGANPDYVIVDLTYSGQNPNAPPVGTGPAISYSVGDNVTLVLPSGALVNKTIIGMTKQTFICGLFLHKDTAQGQFNVTAPMLFFFDLRSGVDSVEAGRTIERELRLNVIVVKTWVKQYTGIIEQEFNLFEAFMGLGLIVGIAGLGIITLRAVHERRREIGMMRAIGFKKRAVVSAFFLESSFIAVTGIVIGIALGIALGYYLYDGMFKPAEFEFYIPVSKIALSALIGYAATAALTIAPALMASRVAPAEAIRFD